MNELSMSSLRPGLWSTDELVLAALSADDNNVQRKAVTAHHQERGIKTVLSLLDNEPSTDVLNSVLGILWYFELPPTAAEPILRLRDHPSASVRTAAATLMGKLLRLSSTRSAVRNALIEMTSDTDRNVRTEAVAALAFSDLLDESVRSALLRCLDDDDDEVRATALVGLAYENRDTRVVELLIDKLSQAEVFNATLEAAAISADPRLLPYLLAVRKPETTSWWLDRAIDACSKTRNGRHES